MKKLYVCDGCSTVVAVDELVNAQCCRLFATPVHGTPNEAFPVACFGLLRPLELAAGTVTVDLLSGPNSGDPANWPVESAHHAPIGG